MCTLCTAGYICYSLYAVVQPKFRHHYGADAEDDGEDHSPDDHWCSNHGKFIHAFFILEKYVSAHGIP